VALGPLQAIPGIGTIASIIGTIALTLAVITVAEAILKMKEEH
jgi:hypothetical protein